VGSNGGARKKRKGRRFVLYMFESNIIKRRDSLEEGGNSPMKEKFSQRPKKGQSNQ